MYLRTLLILIVLGAVAIFAAINWKHPRHRQRCRSAFDYCGRRRSL